MRMTPQRGAELLLEYLDGTLDVDLAQELETYMGKDAEFRAFAETYKATIKAVASAMRQDVPKDAEERALNFLRSGDSSAKVLATPRSQTHRE